MMMFAVQPIVGADELPPPDKPPPAQKRRAQVEIVVCPGEVELASVCVYADEPPLEDVTLRFSDLAPTDGPAMPEKRMAATCFDPYALQWWYRLEREAPAKDRKPLWRGELLLKDTTLVIPDHESKTNKLKYPDRQLRDAETLQPKSLEPGQGVQYLIFVRIPSTTSPGHYRGKIEALSNGKVVDEIPLEVTVLPFRLAEPLLDYTIYYRGGPHPESDVADMLDHGIKRMIWYSYVFSPDNVITLRQKHGITGALFLLGFVDQPRADNDTERIESGRETITRFRTAACDPIYLLVQDEPSAEDMPMVRQQIDHVYRFFGVKTCTALCRGEPWESLKDHLDLPNLFYERPGIGDRKQVALWQSVGKPVYVYGLASGTVADGLRYRRYYGLHPWKLGAQGCAPYAYQHFEETDPWNSMLVTQNFTWPTADGRISTIQFEGMRAAITDVRYVSTLVEWLGRTAGPSAPSPGSGRGRAGSGCHRPRWRPGRPARRHHQSHPGAAGGDGRGSQIMTPMKTTAAAFHCDITPPLGHPLCAGWYPPAAAIGDKLSASGLILAGREEAPVVLCALDWAELSNHDYQRWREQLADAVQTEADRVAVHCVHAHDTPWPDRDAQDLLDAYGFTNVIMAGDWCERARDRTVAAAAQAMGRLERCSDISIGQAQVDRIASNRRVMGEDGKVRAVRWTKTRDPEVRAAPEGLIDPLLT